MARIGLYDGIVEMGFVRLDGLRYGIGIFFEVLVGLGRLERFLPILFTYKLFRKKGD